jgi:hypothetical protein
MRLKCEWQLSLASQFHLSHPELKMCDRPSLIEAHQFRKWIRLNTLNRLGEVGSIPLHPFLRSHTANPKSLLTTSSFLEAVFNIDKLLSTSSASQI